MREDFDFVMMENYQADIAEVSDRARSVVEMLRRENADLLRTIWLLVDAVGGKIDITLSALLAFDVDNSVIEQHERHDTMDVTFVALKRSATETRFQ